MSAFIEREWIKRNDVIRAARPFKKRNGF